MAKTPKAQYEKLRTLSTINLQAQELLKLDIRKALQYCPEKPGVWADTARETASTLLSLADKLVPDTHGRVLIGKTKQERLKLALSALYPSDLDYMMRALQGLEERRKPGRPKNEEARKRIMQLRNERPRIVWEKIPATLVERFGLPLYSVENCKSLLLRDQDKD